MTRSFNLRVTLTDDAITVLIDLIQRERKCMYQLVEAANKEKPWPAAAIDAAEGRDVVLEDALNSLSEGSRLTVLNEAEWRALQPPGLYSVKEKEQVVAASGLGGNILTTKDVVKAFRKLAALGMQLQDDERDRKELDLIAEEMIDIASNNANFIEFG